MPCMRTFRFQLLSQSEAGGDVGLLEPVTQALTEVQDKVIAAIGSQISPHLAEPLAPALMEGASEVLALLIRYDRDTDSPHISSNTGQLRAIQGIVSADRGWESAQRQSRRVGVRLSLDHTAVSCFPAIWELRRLDRVLREREPRNR